MSDAKLRLGSLTALVIGSMIGGGIFSLPQNMAAGAEAGAILIGWVITAIGMLCLAFVFQTLANRKPNLDAGVYAYAKAGFGNYLGFSSAWGYWISAWIGNVGYLVLLFGTLGYFFPIFGEGNTLPAIIAASALLWATHALVLRGIKEATFVNTIITIAKVVPLITFIAIAAIGFKMDIFTTDFWGAKNPDLGSVIDQIKSMMLVTVWVFIGIEGASLYSARAEKRSDVGKATILGFAGVLALLVLVNVLSAGIMTQPELAALRNPSTAYVLEKVVGSWGAAFISIGLVVSLLGAFLSWVLFCSETLYAASKDGTMPAFFHKENKNGVPANALWITNGCIQLFLIITLFSAGTYLKLILLATSMILIPYLFSAGYAALLTIRKETYENGDKDLTKDSIVAWVGTIYGIWLIYAAGLEYFLLSTLLYAPGTFIYVWARKENKEVAFTTAEKVIVALVFIGAIAAIIGLAQGKLSL
ncbi:arginine-ornithine antiporter [Kingella negevensis]|uniref:arginine-ornithine antiporter n=1 Tax=Kingella negevensis TaxID=1522312 RepID=UPI00254C36CE|nr:arginine-ornithine antiporter [Kingella negevensis]MDK4679292.1 arginine-ornithine antiporter [Kingella negevensis]MDK4682986.1 arginine-ornithine antiporter [Kingella negevensis]MDK4691186.1 arginine-ornithine antiporter [Kingella negevensis]MDK4693666.1 arginine-ornithine antiporter [Kingella negevensis]MDK4700482.1 arginine-ornithine antiporter [Kingella negevensis]